MRIMSVAFILFLIASCSQKEAQQKSASAFVTNYQESYVDFVANLKFLNRLGEMDGTSDRIFWETPLTQDIYRNTIDLLEFHKRVWRDQSVSKAVKIRSAKLAQCLSKKERLKLIEEIVQEFKRGAVPDYVVVTYLSPGSQWSSWLDLNYADTEVQTVLNKISSDSMVSLEIAETARSISEGVGADFIKEYGSDVAQKLVCSEIN